MSQNRHQRARQEVARRAVVVGWASRYSCAALRCAELRCAALRCAKEE